MPSPYIAPGRRTPFVSSNLPFAEIGITLLYMILGGIWVVGTDALARRFTGEAPESMELQTLKGLNFVATTGALLYLVLRRSFHRRRRAEDTARLEHERFELAARAATDAIWDLDIPNSRLWWNEGMEKLFGYPASEVKPTLEFWGERLHPDDRERVVAGFRQAIERTDGTHWADEYRFRCRDGRHVFVQDCGYIIRDASGCAVRMVGGMSDIMQRKEAEQRLERSRRQLRALSARLERLREEERTRIAREIHDELGQLLTALKMDLRWMENRLGAAPPDPALNPLLNPLLDKLVEAGELADKTITAVQKISSALRPAILDELGLPNALVHEADLFRERTGLTCQLVVTEPVPTLSPDASTAVFRIFQEALTNVVRHAGATEVRVEFRGDGDLARLSVEDNGRGITPAEQADPKSLGLLGMQERAAVLGGEVRLEDVRPHGTRVLLRLPPTADDRPFWAEI